MIGSFNARGSSPLLGGTRAACLLIAIHLAACAHVTYATTEDGGGAGQQVGGGASQTNDDPGGSGAFGQAALGGGSAAAAGSFGGAISAAGAGGAGPLGNGGSSAAGASGATGGGCAAAFAASACLSLDVGSKVSSGSHNYTCKNANCRNCATYPDCAPGMGPCPWGAVWTDGGACE